MAQGDITFYNDFKERLAQGLHDLDGHTLRITLHTGYTPNIDTHAVWADVSATEYTTSGGYTANGQALSITITQNNTDNRADIDATTITWSSLTLSPATPSHAIIWNDTPTSPADPLIAYIELGSTATNGGDYSIAFSTDLFRFT